MPSPELRAQMLKFSSCPQQELIVACLEVNFNYSQVQVWVQEFLRVRTSVTQMHTRSNSNRTALCLPLCLTSPLVYGGCDR